MGGNHFLKLTPEEGRPHVLKLTGGAGQKPEGQNPALRRVSGLADLKTNASKDAPPLAKFLKLTPDTPKDTGGNARKEPNLQPGPGELACKSSGKTRSASLGDQEVANKEHNEMQHHGHNKPEAKLGGNGNEGARGTTAHSPETTKVERDIDWVDYGFQLPPRRFY